jgi:hypothetical protein
MILSHDVPLGSGQQITGGGWADNLICWIIWISGGGQGHSSAQHEAGRACPF